MSTPPSFAATVAAVDRDALRPRSVSSLMLNLGLRCTMTCEHCHLEASPDREEIMSEATMRAAVRMAKTLRPDVVDITGGSPELHPRIRSLVSELRTDGLRTRVRTNLSALFESGASSLAAFFADAGVELMGSISGPSILSTDGLRGEGAYDSALEALWRLNALGYGSRLRLDLAHNPNGPQLPGSRDVLTRRFRSVLSAKGIAFDSLHVITNMPVGRFGERLRADGGYDDYLSLLRSAFNPDTLRLLNCRDSIEVSWDGTLWDCDFNLAAGLPAFGTPTNVADVDADAVLSRRIVTGDHCFACTAAAGSG